MDTLIELVVQALINLFSGGAQKPGQTPPPLPRQLPGQRPPQRPRIAPLPPQRRPLPPAAMQRPAARPVMKVTVPPNAPRAAAASPRAAAASAPPPSVRHATVPVDAAALRRWLTPKVLHDQFMLSEIFQPPIALRDAPQML